MGNISYFCIVKRFKYNLRWCWVLIFMLLTTALKGQDRNALPKVNTDSIKISLLTCGPGSEVYSLYGHTAIRFQDPQRGQDLAINYGMFSFRQKFFILRFIFGLTDYEMGIIPFQDFLQEYKDEHRWVIEQDLNLTGEEKLNIARAIDENYIPENRVYIYNYFYDNCTTRARDLLIHHVNGRVDFHQGTDATTSYREMTHQWNREHLWARFGNDILLGVKADSKTSFAQQQFLPDSLRKAFAKATITENGKIKPFVDSTFYLIRPQEITNTEGFPLSPRECSLILLAFTVIITCCEIRKKCRFWIYDLVLFASAGIAGVILTAMIFSQHPTVSLNLQILALNPFPLLLIYPIWKRLKDGQGYWFINVWILLIFLFFVGNLFQEYAEGMNFVACSLLLRCLTATPKGRNILKLNRNKHE